MYLNVSIDVWSRLSATEAIIACNTRYIPEAFHPRDIDLLLPRIDGTWGPHEYIRHPQLWDPQSPYMAWISLSHHSDQFFGANVVMRFKMDRDYFTENGLRNWIGGLHKAVKDAFDDDVAFLIHQVSTAKEHAAARIFQTPLQLPDIAVRRANEVLVYLTLQDIYYRDCLEAVATLQRSVAELQGFVLWARYITNDQDAYPQSLLRGAFVPDLHTYRFLARLSIPVWTKVNLAEFFPPPNDLYVHISPFDAICEMRTYLDLPRILDRTELPFQPDKDGQLQLVHSKPLWYYPPRVQETSLFEKVARGLPQFSGLRLDVPNRDKRVDREIRSLTKASGEPSHLHVLLCLNKAIASDPSSRPPQMEPSTSKRQSMYPHFRSTYRLLSHQNLHR